MSVRRSGMTLVEILFAFAIITSVVTLSYAAGLRGWRTAQTGNQRTQAQYIAQDAIERVKAYRDSPAFKWTGAPSLPSSPGTGGFLSDVGNGSRLDKLFYVEACAVGECPSFKVIDPVTSGAAMPSNGFPAVKKPDEVQKISDNTDFFVYLVVTQYYELDTATGATTNTPKAGFPTTYDNVQALSIEAHVEWIDATGNVSNAQASTILTDNVNSQVAYVPTPVPLPSSVIVISTPTPTPSPSPSPSPTPIPVAPPVCKTYFLFWCIEYW